MVMFHSNCKLPEGTGSFRSTFLSPWPTPEAPAGADVPVWDPKRNAWGWDGSIMVTTINQIHPIFWQWHGMTLNLRCFHGVSIATWHHIAEQMDSRAWRWAMQCNQCAYRMSRCDFNRDRGDIVWGQPGLTWMEYGSTDQDWRIRISLATIERSREAIVQSLSMSQVLIKAKTLQRSLCLDNWWGRS